MEHKVGSAIAESLSVQERVAKNINALMLRLKMSPTDLAALTKINKTTITRCLSGETAPSLQSLYEIATALDTTPDKLLVNDVRDISVTGIASIDDLIFDFVEALWSHSDRVRRIIGHRIHPDYRLWYCDALTAEDARGPTFEEEIDLNASYPHHVPTYLHSAAILSDTSIMIHGILLSYATKENQILPRARTHKSTRRFIKTEVIDVWELTHTMAEIRANNNLKWQILARKLKILRESQEV